MDRRIFLKNSVFAGCMFSMNSLSGIGMSQEPATEAMYYRQSARGFKCLLCPKECTIHSDKSGYCMVRVASGNKVITLNYGKPCYVKEATPESNSLYHFLPGTSSLVIGAAGCNLTCLNCPVSHVSQKSPDQITTQNLSPSEVIRTCQEKSVKTLIFGYSEPVVFFEYMLDTAKLAKQNNIKTVMVSSGYFSEEPVKELSSFLDAAVIDIKAFSDAAYTKLSGGSIFPPFKTMKILKEAKIWLELTHKIIPGYTDNFDLVKDMCRWMLDNGYQDVPLHFNMFKPVYKLSQSKPTSVQQIQKATEIAKKAGLHFVYSNHSGLKEYSNTYCPKCNHLLIDRSAKKTSLTGYSALHCSNCKTTLGGVWK